MLHRAEHHLVLVMCRTATLKRDGRFREMDRSGSDLVCFLLDASDIYRPDMRVFGTHTTARYRMEVLITSCPAPP